MQELVSRLEKMGIFSNAFAGKNLKTLLWNALKHKLSNNKVKALRKFIKFCVEKGYLLENEVQVFLKQLKTKPTLPDTKVPKDEEIKQVILKLKSKWLKSYLILLFSGIRVVELKYLKDLWLNATKFENFVRIKVEKRRKTKNVSYVYLPIWLYESMNPNELISDIALKSYFKRRWLLPLKYTRKWFYTKALDLGVPVEIADFYEGRIPQRIGLRHYYNALNRADELYSKILVPYFEEFLKEIFSSNLETKKDKKDLIDLFSDFL